VHYLVSENGGATHGTLRVAGCRVVADGQMVVLEGPWPFGNPALAYIENNAAFATLRQQAGRWTGPNAFAVEGLSQPSAGEAFVVAAHRMRDPERFRPYAERVGAVVQSFGGRFLVRGGKVSLVAGDFLPDRVVVIEFPTAEAAVSFYVSETYAPLLTLRLETTEPRFIIMARRGLLAADARAIAEDYASSRRATSSVEIRPDRTFSTT
jgi:uncharacterized protein (DUF1330 family)